MNALRDWNELPKWIQESYHIDPTIHRLVDEWMEADKPLICLFEKLAIAMYELKNTWQSTYEAAQNPSRITIGD